MSLDKEVEVKMTLTTRIIINTHKMATPFFVILLMFIYDNFTTASYIYLAMHGTYGVNWLLKDLIFPDNSWNNVPSVFEGMMTASMLSMYWIAPILLISQRGEPGNIKICLAVFLNLFGTFFVYVADAQKYFVLQVKKGLITYGMFAKTRNPNYFGESMIYIGFALVSNNLISFLILFFIFYIVMYPRMSQKDVSMARYDDFPDYKRRSYMFLPKIL